MRAPCLEFPSDNPALVEAAPESVTWTCVEAAEEPIPQVEREATAAAEARVESTFECVPPENGIMEDARFVLGFEGTEAMSGHEGDDEEGDESTIEIVDSFEDVEAVDEGATGEDPFRAFLSKLADVLLTAGGEGVADGLPALVAADTFDASALPEPAIDALVEGGLLERTDAGVMRGTAFTRAARAWRCILRGDSDDLTDCGSRTLDEWAADLVARLMAAPARAEQLRRELRKRGVAAFGLVA